MSFPTRIDRAYPQTSIVDSIPPVIPHDSHRRTSSIAKTQSLYRSIKPSESRSSSKNINRKRKREVEPTTCSYIKEPTKKLKISEHLSKVRPNEDTKKKMHEKKIDIIYDQYTHRRGKPQIYNIFCKNCNTFLMQYQKDGPGRLLRCYVDRIRRPKELTNEIFMFINCSNCKQDIGEHFTYRPTHIPEVREAYRMFSQKFYFVVARRDL